MSKTSLIAVTLLLLSNLLTGQSFYDDFEGHGNINSWTGDGCQIDIHRNNPSKKGINTSNRVMEYKDAGELFANVRFDASKDFILLGNSTFTFKIFVPTSGVTGSQSNKVSLKLQNGRLDAPWETQSSVEKNIKLDEWQEVSFDFSKDPFINFNPQSREPIERLDFNRVIIQINGEDNNDKVTAYIDDFSYVFDGLPDASYDKLVWSDEFETAGAINSQKWYPQTILPTDFGWYNNELQHYTNRLESVFVQDGSLHIVAKKELFNDQGQIKNYTSARLNSKFAFTYGRIEVKAKLPVGVGTLPAIWMLGRNIDEKGGYWQTQGYGKVVWPDCGEIDIMEHWGANQNYASSATHTPTSYGNTINVGGQTIPTATQSFHIYELEWTEEYMIFRVDGKLHLIFSPAHKNQSNWPFDDPFYILLNIAILPDISPGFEESAMEIDYVRVYQESASSRASLSNQRVAVFPNPVGDVLYVQNPFQSDGRLGIEIYDLQGKPIKNYQTQRRGEIISLQWVEQLHPGAYILSLTQGNKKISTVFIKD